MGRQKPQWTQSSISSCSGGWWSSKAGRTATPASGRRPPRSLSAWPGSAPTSSGSPSGPWPRSGSPRPARGPAPVPAPSARSSQIPPTNRPGLIRGRWVEPLLDPAHQPERVPGRPPGVDLPLEVGGALTTTRLPPAGGQPLPGLGDPTGPPGTAGLSARRSPSRAPLASQSTPVPAWALTGPPSRPDRRQVGQDRGQLGRREGGLERQLRLLERERAELAGGRRRSPPARPRPPPRPGRAGRRRPPPGPPPPAGCPRTRP